LDARRKPIIIRVGHTSFLDHLFFSYFPSYSALMIEANPAWNMLIIKSEICFIIRELEGQITIYTHTGQRFRTFDQGKSWEKSSWSSAIRLLGGRFSKNVVITHIDGYGSDFVGAIADYIGDKSVQGKVKKWIVGSRDAGRTFQYLTEISDEYWEIGGLILLRNN